MALNLESYYNVHVPFTLEDEISKFSERDGYYKIDFRMKSTTSELAVKSEGSFFLDGVPFVAAGLRAPFTTEPEAIPYKLPKLTRNLGNSPAGSLVPHPSARWTESDYYGLKVDFVLQYLRPVNANHRLPDGNDTQTFVNQITAISGYYLIVENGVIVGWSDALRYAVESFILKHNIRGVDFNDKVSKIPITQYFNNPADEIGLDGLFYHSSIMTTAGQKQYGATTKGFFGGSIGQERPIAVSGIRDFRIGARFQHVLTARVQSGIVVLTPNPSADILPPRFYLTHPFEVDLAREGGSYSTTSIFDNNLPPGVTMDATRALTTRIVTGTGTPGDTLIVHFLPSSLTQSVMVLGSGIWSVELPPSVTYNTPQELTAIQVTKPGTTSSSVNTRTETIANPTKVMQLGLPLLTSDNAAARVSDTYPTLSDTAPRNRSEWGDWGVQVPFREPAHTAITKDIYDMPYVVMGLRVGPSATNDQLIHRSYPCPSGAVLENIAVAVIFSAAAVGTDKQGFGPSTYTGVVDGAESIILNTIFLKKAPQVQSIAPPLTLLWENHRLSPQNIRLRTSYRKSWESARLTYNTKFRRGAEKNKRFLRYRTRWDTKLYRKRSLQYTFRYNLGLPDKVTKRAFYVLEWRNRQQFTRALRYASRWRVTLSRVKSLEYKTKWNTTPVEPVIVKPFYVKTFDETARTWTEKISFQVYGNPLLVQDYVATDNLWFYFSNPDKYEIVKFNYNMLPYEGVFLEELKDPSLDDREGIPENYILVGNYTVKGINPVNSVSLDVIGGDKQLNESRSYWIPSDIGDWSLEDFTKFEGRELSYTHKLDFRFRDDHNEDVVELDLIILNEEECCFTQKSSGSRCSPF